jgi:hypothetical protein
VGGGSWLYVTRGEPQASALDPGAEEDEMTSASGRKGPSDAADDGQGRPIEPNLLLEDYKLGVPYLTNQYTRMCTRFNYFVSLETALAVAMVGLYKDERLSADALFLPGIALLFSLCWYLTGAQDRYLVEVYRKQVAHTAQQLAPDVTPPWAYLGAEIKMLVPLIGHIPNRIYQFRWEPISITKLAAWIPLLAVILWLLCIVTIAIKA